MSATELGAPPAVSVLLPTYQRRDWVCRAVRSVFAQHFTDWELIVVDDGSTDGTGEALQAFGPRLRYLWQENKGVSAARNAGLRLAQGEIVAFLDSDDRWLPDHLETVVAMLERDPEAVLACTCPRSHVAGREHPRNARLVDALPLLLVDNFLCAPATAVRRQDLAEVGWFDEGLPVLEDGELWLRLATRGPFALLQRRTIIRQHTRGSLIQRGARRGEYLPAMERMAESGMTQVASLARDDKPALLARAEGKLRYCEALRALDDDEEVTRVALQEACTRLPELASDPWFVNLRIKRVFAAPGVDRYQALARLWPEPRSDAALFLRLQAILLAFRLGRPRHAFALLREFPLRAAPGFIVRSRSLFAVLLTRRVQSRLYRGEDFRREGGDLAT